MSGAIVAKSGQNLNFNSGEYMIIAFGSAGTTNVFFASPNTGTVNLDMAFISTANYVVSGYPTTFTTALQSSGLTSKICMELY